MYKLTHMLYLNRDNKTQEEKRKERKYILLYQIYISEYLMQKNYFSLLFQLDHITQCFYR